LKEQDFLKDPALNALNCPGRAPRLLLLAGFLHKRQGLKASRRGSSDSLG
jgi:hypothetical protein